jgi:hypothetical protein
MKKLTRPVLVIALPFEEPANVFFCSNSREDERRLVEWLQGSEVWRRLPEFLPRMLDDHDRCDGDWHYGTWS